MFKKKKEKKVVQDKDFIRFKAFYPECGVIEIKTGLFLKMYEFKNVGSEAFSKEDHEQSMAALLTYIDQFFYRGDKLYGILAVKADIIDEAVEEFKSRAENFKYLLVFEYREVDIKQWFNLISNRTILRDLDDDIWERLGKKVTIKGAIQPYDRKTEDSRLRFGELISKTVMLTNFSSFMFEGFMTEVCNISDNISASLFVNTVNIKHCLDAINLESSLNLKRSVMKNYLEKTLEDKGGLLNVCLFINVTGLEGEVEDTFNRIRHLCTKHGMDINNLEYQQNQAFISSLPLYDCCIKYNKVLDSHKAITLLNNGWINVLHSTVKYGNNTLSKKPLEFDRASELINGFIISDDYSGILHTVSDEVNAYRVKYSGRKIAVFDLERDLEHCTDVSDVGVLTAYKDVNREMLRVLFYMVCGYNGSVSERSKGIFEEATANEATLMDFGKFVTAVKELDRALGTKLEKYETLMTNSNNIEMSKNYEVFSLKCDDPVETMLHYMGAIARCDANIIYIMNGEKFADIRDNRFLDCMFNNAFSMYTVTSRYCPTLFSKNIRVKKLIKNSDFIYAFNCDSGLKTSLRNTLGLDAEQALFTEKNKDINRALLYSKYATYMLER